MIRNKNVDKWLERKVKKAQFWQVKNFLKGLRLQFKESDVGMDSYCVAVPLFGMKFRFNGQTELSDVGWKVFLLDKDKLERVPEYFREDVMWYLVEKGYMSYAREIEVGGSNNLYNRILIDSGWGIKIMERRIELCGKAQENTYTKLRMEEYIKLPISKIISYCPGFFDYLM